MTNLPRNEEIGGRIKQARENLGLSQSEFAKKVGLTQSAISQFEKGERLPSFIALQKVSQGLNVTSDFLISGVSCDDSDPEKTLEIEQLFIKLKNSDKEAVVQLNRYYDTFLNNGDPK